MKIKNFKWAVNIDKLRVCFNMPEHLYEYLHDHYSRYNELDKTRILDEDDFNLVFINEDETTMSAVLNVRDIEGYYRLGTFTFSNSAKYEGKAFFAFENSALYRIYAKIPSVAPQNHICDLLYVANYYGMTFNNITELELAFDSIYNYVRTIRNWIKDIANFDLYLNGKKVKDAELLAGYGEYYTRNRNKLSSTPTLYFSQKKDTDMKMRVYDKSKELEENSPQKAEQVKEWLGWDDMSQLYRIEGRAFCFRRKACAGVLREGKVISYDLVDSTEGRQCHRNDSQGIESQQLPICIPGHRKRGQPYS